MTRTRQINHNLQNPSPSATGICEGQLDRTDASAARMAAERERQLIALRLASPKRAAAGAIVADRADAAHLPLFIAANEPTLF